MSSEQFNRNALDADGIATGEIRRVAHQELAYKGWRMDVRPGNMRFIRFFADNDFGGDYGALRAARMARAALLMEECR